MLTVSQIAEQLNVGPETVRAWIRNGDLAAYDLSAGGRPTYRVEPEAVRAFVAKRAIRAKVITTGPAEREWV